MQPRFRHRGDLLIPLKALSGSLRASGYIISALVGFTLCWALTHHSCRSDGKAEGRIFLAEPAPRWEPPPSYSVTLPDSPRVAETVPGPAVEVETLVPEDPRVEREIRDRFALDPEELILALKDLPRYRWGADMAVTERDGRVGATARAFTPPVFSWEWEHAVGADVRRLYPGGEAADFRSYSYEPLTVWVKGRFGVTPVIGYIDHSAVELKGPYFGIRARLVLAPRGGAGLRGRIE